MRLSITDLLPSTQYALQFRAVSADNASDWSRRFIIVTIADTDPPATPTSFTFVTVGNNFHAEWDSVNTTVTGKDSSVSRYEIELVAGGITKVVSVPQKTGGTKVTYDLDQGTNLSLFGSLMPSVAARVRAVDNKDLKGSYTNPITATNAAPGAPTGLTATGVLNAVNLAWTAPSDTDIAGYNIYVGATLVAFHANTKPSTSINYTYFTTTYSAQTFNVKTVDIFGQESSAATATATPQSPFGGDSTAPGTPTSFAGTITTDNNLRTVAALTWAMVSPPTDLAGFDIRYRKVGDTNWFSTKAGYDDRAISIVLPVPYANYEFQIRAYDFSSNASAYTSTLTLTGATNSAPSTPQAPTVSSNTLQIQVTPTGLTSGAVAMDTDVVYYEVYASTTTGFTPATANMLGSISVGPAMSQTFPVPASAASGTTQTWYVKVIAVDRGGLKSSASAQATASPNLISSGNFADASITNAKILNLAADKIIAGTGLINDITVKSKLTLGDGTNTGAIESFDYSSGSTGFRLASDGLVIRTGSISAAALSIQIGKNIIPPQYADFEGPASFYQVGQGLAASGGSMITSVGTGKFNQQSLSTLWGTQVTIPVIYLGRTITDYNIAVEGGKTYIFSAYVWVAGSVSTPVTMRVKWSDASMINIATVTPATGTGPTTAVRVTGSLTAPAGATGALVAFQSSSLVAASGFNVDGVQVEEKITSLTTPSSWAPPGATRIDGSLIRTGSIQSSAFASYWDATAQQMVVSTTDPMWSINTGGAATFGDLLVRGRVVVGTTSEPPTGQSTMASANYIPGFSGWMIQSNGDAEFLQLKSGSIDGAAIVTGTLDASAISTGYLQSDITLTGTFLSPTNSRSINVTTVSGSGALTFPDGDLLPSDANGVLTATGIPPGSSINYVSTSTGTLKDGVAATASGTATAAFLSSGRSVSISGTDGISIYEADGTPTILLPTDASQPITFNGQINATAMTIADNFSLSGQNNGLAAGANFVLTNKTAASSVPPQFAFTYNNYQSWVDGKTYSDGIYGFSFESTTNTYTTANKFFGAQALSMNLDGTFVANTNITNNSGFSPLGGVVKVGSSWYVLGNDTGQFGGTWTVRKYSADWSTYQDAWSYNDGMGTSSTLWNPGIGGSSVNSEIYIARANASGKIVIRTYSLTGTLTNTLTTSVTANTNMKSVLNGTFDMGETTYFIVTTGTPVRMNYVFTTTGTHVPLKSFPTAGNSGHAGMTWNGSIFKSLDNGGKVWDYTALSDGVQTAWSLKSSYATGVTQPATYETEASKAVPITVLRRSRMTVTSSRIPSTGAPSDPNAVRFYLSTVASPSTTDYWLQTPLTAAGVLTKTITAAVSSTSNPIGNNYPSGVPASIVSSTGNSFWKGDDSAQFYQLVLRSATDASTVAGNMPPLRIGNPAAAHMRVDSNEFIAMADNTTQAQLILNAGGRAILPVKTWQTGTSAITPSAANTATSLAVTFPTAFLNTPMVVLQLLTGVSAATYVTLWPSAVSASGFTINIVRGNTTATSVRWFAVDV